MRASSVCVRVADRETPRTWPVVRKRYDTAQANQRAVRQVWEENVLPVASGISSRGTLAIRASRVVVSVVAKPKP